MSYALLQSTWEHEMAPRNAKEPLRFRVVACHRLVRDFAYRLPPDRLHEFPQLLAAEACRARLGYLRQLSEQLLVHYFEVKARLALHVLLQFRRHAGLQVSTCIDRHQVKADVRLAQSHSAEENSLLVFHHMRRIKIVVRARVMDHDHPGRVRLQNRF